MHREYSPEAALPSRPTTSAFQVSHSLTRSAGGLSNRCQSLPALEQSITKLPAKWRLGLNKDAELNPRGRGLMIGSSPGQHLNFPPVRTVAFWRGQSRIRAESAADSGDSFPSKSGKLRGLSPRDPRSPRWVTFDPRAPRTPRRQNASAESAVL